MMTNFGLFGLFSLAVLLVLVLFRLCYKKGLVVRLFQPLLHIPLLKHRMRRIYEKNLPAMQQIDDGVAYLHSQPRAFFLSLLWEYVARVVNALEYYFSRLSLGVSLSFLDAVLVLAFSSLIGNLLFFLPMQLGAREGGLLMIVRILGLSTSGIGIFTSLYTRVRELVWICIGVSLVKVGNNKLMKEKS